MFDPDLGAAPSVGVFTINGFEAVVKIWGRSDPRPTGRVGRATGGEYFTVEVR